MLENLLRQPSKGAFSEAIRAYRILNVFCDVHINSCGQCENTSVKITVMGLHRKPPDVEFSPSVHIIYGFDTNISKLQNTIRIYSVSRIF